VADSGNNLIRTTRIVPPTLQFWRAGDQLVTSWPVSSEGFVLETSPSLTGGAWTPLSNGIVVSGDNIFQTNNSSSPAFYRLRKP